MLTLRLLRIHLTCFYTKRFKEKFYTAILLLYYILQKTFLQISSLCVNHRQKHSVVTVTYIKLGVFITHLLGNNRLNYGNVIKHLTFYQMTDKRNNFYKNGKK